MRHPSVLVVEDDEDTRELYRLALTVYGFRVVPVRDGLDALRRVEGRRFALIVLDLGLPCVSGADVVKELASHSETRSIPIVVVTGQEPQHVERQVACVLRKPIDTDALCATVRHHIAATEASLLCS